MNENREDVVRSALIIERWCREHRKEGAPCDCPLYLVNTCWIKTEHFPDEWILEIMLSCRGLPGKPKGRAKDDG